MYKLDNKSSPFQEEKKSFFNPCIPEKGDRALIILVQRLHSYITYVGCYSSFLVYTSTLFYVSEITLFYR